MASSSLLKLLRNRQSQSASRISTCFRQPSFLAQNQIPQIQKPYHPTSFPDHQPAADFSKPDQPHIFPSFPFGFFLDPIFPTPLVRPGPDDETVPDESVVIRADSVKKKRKKKMNKHKLRKLRKRLRRKTKT